MLLLMCETCLIFPALVQACYQMLTQKCLLSTVEGILDFIPNCWALTDFICLNI